MEEVELRWQPESLLFNSTLETGVRTLFILNAVYPKGLDLLHLTWFDHLIVHTADIDGPESLHPDVPFRNGELLVRRHLIEDGLRLMQSLHLVDVINDTSGISFTASDSSASFVELMRSDYSYRLKSRADWLAKNVFILDFETLQSMITKKLGRWNIEFHTGSEKSILT